MTAALSRRQLIAMTTGGALLCRQALAFTKPIHLLPDPSGRFLLIASHASLDVYARNRNGSAGPLIDRVVLTGPLGPHRVEQARPRPCNIRFDPGGRFLMVTDLGRDRIESYNLNPAGKLTFVATAMAREGAGPSELRFHPTLPFAYVANALNATITAHRFDPASGALTPIQIMPTLPDDHVGGHSGVTLAVSPCGEWACATHEGGTEVFAVAAATGRLTRRRAIPCV